MRVHRTSLWRRLRATLGQLIALVRRPRGWRSTVKSLRYVWTSRTVFSFADVAKECVYGRRGPHHRALQTWRRSQPSDPCDSGYVLLPQGAADAFVADAQRASDAELAP